MSRTNIQLSRFLQAILVFRPVCYLDQYWFMIIHLWFLIMRSEICFVCTLLVLAAKVLWNVDRPVLFRCLNRSYANVHQSPRISSTSSSSSSSLTFTLRVVALSPTTKRCQVASCTRSTCTYRAGSTSFWCQHSGKGRLQWQYDHVPREEICLANIIVILRAFSQSKWFILKYY